MGLKLAAAAGRSGSLLLTAPHRAQAERRRDQEKSRLTTAVELLRIARIYTTG
jgi:hypothetical protein